MIRKMFLLLLLSMHASVKPIIGEIVLGAVGAAALKIATSPSGKAARWAATGYLLNTPAGKKFAALGFSKIRQIVSSRIFPAQVGAGASTTLSVAMVQASRNALRNCGQTSMQLFRSMPKSIAEFRARVAAMTFRNPFSKVTEFHAETNSAAFGSGASTARAPFTGANNKFAQAFTYRKAQAGPTAPFATANSYSVHQAKGLFPRINHYHGDQGRAKFWKGFAAGSFGSWATAWYLGNRKTEQQDAPVSSVSA